MDFRKYKDEDVAGQARQARVWDARLMALPTSYARLERAARSLGDIGIPARCPRQPAVVHEPGVDLGVVA